MASHNDLATRKEAAGITAEIYVSDPPKVLRDVGALIASGNWPALLNVKGTDADHVIVVMPLIGWEHTARTGFEGDE